VVRRKASQYEDAGADDGADAERGETDRAEDAPQAMLAGHLGQQHLDRLHREELPPPPHPPAHSTGFVARNRAQPARPSAARTRTAYAAWRRRVVAPGRPSPTRRRSSRTTGRISTVELVRNISRARR